MATLSELTFDGGTNGATVVESGWATLVLNPAKYTTADAAHGAASMEITDLAYGSIGYNVTGRTAWRLRTYVKWNGSQSGHIYIVRLNTGLWSAGGVHDATYGGDVSIRNVDGGKLTCRWNYDSTSIAASAMTANVWTRVDLHWSSAAGMTLYVYQTGDDTTVAYTLTDADAAGQPITGLWVGKENSGGGIIRHDSIALTEGEDPGPYNAATPVDGVATYALTITHAADAADVGSRTYEIDATGSTGTVSLAWDGSDRGTITESPTGVFTLSDPNDGDTALALTLTAAGSGGGTDDTASISIARGGASIERPLVYTFQGGDYTDPANWA